MKSLEFLSQSVESCSTLVTLATPLELSSILPAVSTSPSGCTRLLVVLGFPSLDPQHTSLIVLTKYKIVSIKSTAPSRKKSRLQEYIQLSFSYLKRQYSDKKAASPKIKMILSITGYLKSPFQACRIGQIITIIITKCKQMTLAYCMYNAINIDVASNRKQPKNSNHFTQMLAFLFWIHFNTISWPKGNKAKTPRTIAGPRIVVRSIVVELSAFSIVQVELVTKGTQIHLINPLRVRQTGQYSTAFPQHFLNCTKRKVTKSKPNSITENDNLNPFEQTKSPLVQKVNIFLLKSTVAVPRQLEKDFVFIVNAKMQHIWRNYNPLKY